MLKNSQESLGPTDDDEAEFAKELAKMVVETSTETRKVDKKTALALWESTVPPPGMRKKRPDDHDDEADPMAQGGEDGPGVMNFTLFTKRGNKQMACSPLLTLADVCVLTEGCIDAATGYPRRVYAGCADPNCPITRQSRAAAFEEARAQLRTTRRG